MLVGNSIDGSDVDADNVFLTARLKDTEKDVVLVIEDGMQHIP